jgi:hypothetical protein
VTVWYMNAASGGWCRDADGREVKEGTALNDAMYKVISSLGQLGVTFRLLYLATTWNPPTPGGQ